MALNAGDRIGPYEILGPLGKGGMGEVYRGRDTKLGREVAIKILPTAFAQFPDRLIRFEREAKVLAKLNHPNIATIYTVEDSSEGKALVMELVPGAPIRGPLPEAQAVKYAIQIASAIEAAHEQGVIHRDLKPGNIMLTPDGVVKVLDFGLAAVAQPAPEDGVDGETAATLTLSPTRAGMILGTAPYMSPEQAHGRPVDARSDIFSFGAVLYEMVSGRRAFRRDSTASTTRSIRGSRPCSVPCVS